MGSWRVLGGCGESTVNSYHLADMRVRLSRFSPKKSKIKNQKLKNIISERKKQRKKKNFVVSEDGFSQFLVFGRQVVIGGKNLKTKRG